MAISLTVDFIIPNGKRILVDVVRVNEEAQEMTVSVQLRTTGATDHIVTERTIVIRNGSCDRVTRGTITAGQRMDDLLVYQPDALTVAAGYTNAFNAWKVGANPGARRQALETHLLAIGYLHASLAGT